MWCDRFAYCHAWGIVTITVVFGFVVADSVTSIERGRRIFEEGLGLDGAIEAALNDGKLVLPAKMLTCSGCHGIDGRGGTEGGVDVADIRWSALSRPLKISGGMKRSRSGYDVEGLKRAITMGWDMDGNPLHRAMPRYRLSSVDAADLVAYLQNLDSRDPEGVRGDRIVIATLAPPGSGSERLGRYEKVLRDSIDSLNREGGVYGRAIELVSFSAGPAREEMADHFRVKLDEVRPLAVIAPFFAGVEDELIEITEESGIPVIAPLAYAPEEAHNDAGRVFWILPGKHHAVEVLARQAAESIRGPESDVVLLLPANQRTHRDTLPVGRVAKLVRKHVESMGQVLSVIHYGAGAHDAAAVVASVWKSEASSALILGDRIEIETLVQEFLHAGQAVDLFLLSGSVAAQFLREPERFKHYAGRIHFALPALSGLDGSVKGGVLEQTAEMGVQVLIEGLRRAGERVSRAALADALESLSDYQQRPFPAVRFGPGRRNGVRGALVFSLGADTPANTTRWVSLDGI